MHEEAQQSHWNGRITILCVLFAFGFIILVASQNTILKSVKHTPRTTQINHAKQITIALYHFAKDHDGLFPCDATGPAATATDCFNQLLAGGYIEDESIFWKRPNLDLGIVSKAALHDDGVLTAKENRWGYVKGLTTSSRTNLPLLFDSSNKPGKFDTEIWDGLAIIAKVNGSVEALAIDYTGATVNTEGTSKTGPITEDGKDIFQSLPAEATILLARARR